MLDISTLETWLWDAACAIRGPVDAPKFKDYILPLVFLKRLSDVFDDEIERLSAASSPSRIAHGSLVQGSMELEAAAAGGGAASAVGAGAVGAADDAGVGAGAPVAGASRSNVCFAAHNILFRFWSFAALSASQQCAFAAKSSIIASG